MKITFAFLHCPGQIVLPPAEKFLYYSSKPLEPKSINRFLDSTYTHTSLYTSVNVPRGELLSVKPSERRSSLNIREGKELEGKRIFVIFFFRFPRATAFVERSGRRGTEWGEAKGKGEKEKRRGWKRKSGGRGSRQMQSSILDSLFALYSGSTGLSFHVLAARRFADCPFAGLARELSPL